MTGNKLLIDPAIIEHVLDCAGDESSVAAGMNLKEIVGYSGSEQGALGIGGHPVSFQAGLSIRVNDDYASSFFFGEVDVFGGNGLVVRSVASKQDQQVRADPIPV